MRPAHQRFEAAHRAARHRDLRLVDEASAGPGRWRARRSVMRVSRRRCSSSCPARYIATRARVSSASSSATCARCSSSSARLPVRGEQAHPARQAQIEADAGEVKAAADHRGELLGVQQRALGGAAAARSPGIASRRAARRCRRSRRSAAAAARFRAARRPRPAVPSEVLMSRRLRKLDEQQRRARLRLARAPLTRLSSSRARAARDSAAA